MIRRMPIRLYSHNLLVPGQFCDDGDVDTAIATPMFTGSTASDQFQLTLTCTTTGLTGDYLLIDFNSDAEHRVQQVCSNKLGSIDLLPDLEPTVTTMFDFTAVTLQSVVNRYETNCSVGVFKNGLVRQSCGTGKTPVSDSLSGRVLGM